MQRIYVHKDVSDNFTNLFTKKTFEGLRLGDPMKDETNIGPLAISESLEHVHELVNDAVSMGGTLLIGGNQNTDSEGKGRFYEPTVIA